MPYGNQGQQIQQTGKEIGSAIEGFGDLFKKIRQDKIANQLMNQGPTGQPGGGVTTSLGQAPGSPTDQPVAQDFSLPSGQGIGGQTVGSLIHTGGTDELALRQNYQKAQTAQALENAKLADFQAKAAGTGRYAPKPGVTVGGGSGSRWQQQAGQAGGYGGKPQKPAAYVAGSSDPNDPSSDDMSKVRADYDLIHGKGSFDKAQQNINQWTIQNGQYVLPGKPDAQGNPTYQAQMSVDEGNKWILRTNAARMAQGLPQLPVAVPVGGSNPKSTDPPGSLTNPYKPTNALESRGIPNDSYLVDPTTGQTVHKRANQDYKKPQDQAAVESKPAEPDTSSTQDTSSTDNTGLGDEELANEATTSSGQDSSVDDAIAEARAKRDMYA
jgi:hypothetical protein